MNSIAPALRVGVLITISMLTGAQLVKRPLGGYDQLYGRARPRG